MEPENLTEEKPLIILPNGSDYSDNGDENEPEQEVAQERKSNPLKHGLIWYVENGFYQPMNGKVIARAIMPTDYSAFGGGALDNVIDTRFAVAWEIISLAPDIPPEAGLQVGMWFHHLSTSSNRIDKETKSSRYYSLWYQDVEGVFWPATEDDDGNLAGEEVVLQSQKIVADTYPWQAQKMPGREAWIILNGQGEDIGVRLKQATAEQIADAVNRRSAYDTSAPQAASFPQSAFEQEFNKDPKANLKRLLEALSVDQKQTVLIAEEVKGLEAAENLAEGFLAINRQKQHKPELDEAPPQPNPNGSYGVYANPANPPIARFSTQAEASAWSEKILNGVNTVIKEVGAGLDQPSLVKPRSAPPPPYEGAQWGTPPGNWSKRL